MLHKVHGPVPWVNPFTIRPFSSYPSLLLGRRTTGKGIGVNTHHCVSISDRMAGWPSTPVIRVVNWSPNDMGMYIYISQRKYISYLTPIHTLSPYEFSHTIIPVTCVYNGLIWHQSLHSNIGINHFIACTITYVPGYLSFTIYSSNIHWLQSSIVANNSRCVLQIIRTIMSI